MARQTDRQTDRQTEFLAACAILSVCVFVLSACGFVGANGRKDLTAKAQVKYADAFEKAVKACRELDLLVNLSNKDTGQVQCGLKSSEANIAGTGYSVDVLLEKDQEVLKRVDVKVDARSGIYWGLPSDSDAQEFAGKYLDALKRLGVE